MLKSNFKILIRGLWRKKSFSLLNISGLAVGIAVSLLIFVLIRYELSVDDYHVQRNRIYRVVSTETFRNGLVFYDGCVPGPLPAALRREFPQVGQVAAVYRTGPRQFTLPAPGRGTDKQFRTGDVYYAEPSLFKIFDFPWIAGDPVTALQEPNTAVITRSLAERWFGHWQDAVGKTILQGDERQPFRVTGILEDPPVNTDLPLKVVLSYATYYASNAKQMADPGDWDNFDNGSQCFFLLAKGQRIESMNAMLPDFVARHYTPLFEHSDTRDSSYFQPLKQMHFESRFDRFGNPGWSYAELWSMGLIGIFLLAVACINFINLSTAQSLNRAKEVGIRKVLGSNRRQLLKDFLFETSLLVAFAMILGCILAALLSPPLAQILEKPVHLDLFSTSSTLVFLVVTGIAVVFLAGLYPGIVLAGFDPVAAFKSKINTKTIGGISLRRSLIVLQFVIAQLLIIGTLVIVRQMDFFRSRPMGFDRDAIALVGLPGNRENLKKEDFKRRVLQMPGVLSASLCSSPPSSDGNGSTLFTFESHTHPEDFEPVNRFADSDYLKTFHIGLVAGRYPYSSDTVREVLFNETAVKSLGIRSPEEILGRSIVWGGRSGQRTRIVGVVRDFNSASLREKIRPLFIFSAADNYGTLAVKMEPGRIKSTVSRIREIYAKTYPEQVFDVAFFDEQIVNFYNAEAIASRLFKIFAILAIFISSLGLYGLVSFMAVQKTKEVGIRKVLGASVSSIVYMFSREFTLLIGLAFLIAAPLGYYFMRGWLSEYYYHTKLGWEVFAIAISSSVLIAWITVGYKAVKAAIANPVKSLRAE